jgi:hypothetical protein
MRESLNNAKDPDPDPKHGFLFTILLFRRENTHMGMLEYDRSQEDKLLKALILGETSPLTSSRISSLKQLFLSTVDYQEYQQFISMRFLGIFVLSSLNTVGLIA